MVGSPCGGFSLHLPGLIRHNQAGPMKPQAQKTLISKGEITRSGEWER